MHQLRRLYCLGTTLRSQSRRPSWVCWDAARLRRSWVVRVILHLALLKCFPCGRACSRPNDTWRWDEFGWAGRSPGPLAHVEEQGPHQAAARSGMWNVLPGGCRRGEPPVPRKSTPILLFRFFLSFLALSYCLFSLTRSPYFCMK